MREEEYYTETLHLFKNLPKLTSPNLSKTEDTILDLKNCIIKLELTRIVLLFLMKKITVECIKCKRA